MYNGITAYSFNRRHILVLKNVDIEFKTKEIRSTCLSNELNVIIPVNIKTIASIDITPVVYTLYILLHTEIIVATEYFYTIPGEQNLEKFTSIDSKFAIEICNIRFFLQFDTSPLQINNTVWMINNSESFYKFRVSLTLYNLADRILERHSVTSSKVGLVTFGEWTFDNLSFVKA